MSCRNIRRMKFNLTYWGDPRGGAMRRLCESPENHFDLAYDFCIDPQPEVLPAGMSSRIARHDKMRVLRETRAAEIAAVPLEEQIECLLTERPSRGWRRFLDPSADGNQGGMSEKKDGELFPHQGPRTRRKGTGSGGRSVRSGHFEGKGGSSHCSKREPRMLSSPGMFAIGQYAAEAGRGLGRSEKGARRRKDLLRATRAPREVSLPSDSKKNCSASPSPAASLDHLASNFSPRNAARPVPVQRARVHVGLSC